MAARLGVIKQKTSSWGSAMNNTFLLFYSPKPRSQVGNFNISKMVYYGSLFAMNLRHYLWMTKSQLCVKRICLSPTHYIKRYKQRKQKTKTIAIRFNLLQVYPSVPPFAFVVLFIPSFYFLSGYFYVLFNLVLVPAVWILINVVLQLLLKATALTCDGV